MKTHTYDPDKSWEENYRALEAHHVEETTALKTKLISVWTQVQQLQTALAVQQELNKPTDGVQVVVEPYPPGYMSCTQPGSGGSHSGDPCIVCGFRYTDG